MEKTLAPLPLSSKFTIKIKLESMRQATFDFPEISIPGFTIQENSISLENCSGHS